MSSFATDIKAWEGSEKKAEELQTALHLAKFEWHADVLSLRRTT